MAPPTDHRGGPEERPHLFRQGSLIATHSGERTVSLAQTTEPSLSVNEHVRAMLVFESI